MSFVTASDNSFSFDSVGLFPSIFDWVVNVSNRSPLGNDADGNTNFPGGDGWFGILAWKRGALLVSFVWVAILVREVHALCSNIVPFFFLFFYCF
jgi:hypothetical protein